MASAVCAAEAEQLGGAGGHRHRQLKRVVQPARHDGHLCAESALDLVRDRQGQQEIRAAGVFVLGHREDGAEVVGRMAQAAGRSGRCRAGRDSAPRRR